MIALKKLWKNDYFKTVIAIALIVGIVLGFFFGLQLGLHTSYPLLTVESGSMSIPYDGNDNFWASITRPFDRTLSIGDIIVVQGINTKDLNTNYPNSDIIVFHSPIDGELIVHRIISSETVNGVTYYLTKGDGNGYPDTWPNNANSRNRSVGQQQSTRSTSKLSSWQSDYAHSMVWMDNTFHEKQLFGLTNNNWHHNVACNS